MQKGWSAKGLLRPLWQSYPGKRDGLADAVGAAPSTLSALNTGKRNLGYDLGGRLAAELGVSLLELGAPEAAADEDGVTLVRRLELVEAQLARLTELVQEGFGLELQAELEAARRSPRARPVSRRVTGQ